MKAKILDVNGKESKELELPKIFSSKIREDISQKYYEASKKQQPYAPYFLAGKQASASGKIKHGRRKWKTSYGKGISRVPRKIFWRRGTQFYWQGATIASAVGGRRAHPPRVEHFLKKLKINKKEKSIAISSAITATASPEYLKKRYETLEEIKVKLPLIVESKILKLKTKEFFSALKKILGDVYEIAIKKKKKRAGKGTRRGRKYKISAGLLLVIGKDEEKKIKGIDVMKVCELKMQDLYPLGRLAVYSEEAIKDLGDEQFGERKLKEKLTSQVGREK